jgi:hypothetical protein
MLPAQSATVNLFPRELTLFLSKVPLPLIPPDADEWLAPGGQFSTLTSGLGKLPPVLAYLDADYDMGFRSAIHDTLMPSFVFHNKSELN